MLDYSPALQQTYDFEATGHSIQRTCVWVQVYACLWSSSLHIWWMHTIICAYMKHLGSCAYCFGLLRYIIFRHGGTVGSMCKMVKSLLPCPPCILSDWTDPSKAIFPKIKPRRGADGAEWGYSTSAFDRRGIITKPDFRCSSCISQVCEHNLLM